MLLAQDLDAIQRSSGLPIWHLYVEPAFFITIILTYIFPIAGMLLLFYLVTGGLQMMLSRGDPKAIQAAQGKITNAILGIVIMAAAFAIVGLIGRLLGIEVFGLIFKR